MVEKRQATVENILIELGALRSGVEDTKRGVEGLNVKVGIQNGRIGKMELQGAFIKGIICVLTFIVFSIAIPLGLELFKRWITTHV